MYLNYTSTDATDSGVMNPSDLAYPQMLRERYELNEVENRIRKLINAPLNSKVIINSGATESIANCVFWAKAYNPDGTVVGTYFDHSAVADNCANFDVKYDNKLNIKDMNERASMIMLTHVNARTGEILDIDTFTQNMNTYRFMYTGGDNGLFTGGDNSRVRLYRPLLALDATQSIMRVPIDMEKWKLNAVFFSLHKIGTQSGIGVLVISEPDNIPFKPLIAGKQQHGLRGGTLPTEIVSARSYVFDNMDNSKLRQNTWKHAWQYLHDHKVNVYKPRGKHLYNTLLCAMNGCPMTAINSLALSGIYVGNVSACANEDAFYNKDTVKTSDNPYDNAIRISFRKDTEITDEILDKIIETIT